MVSFTLNNRAVAVDADPRTPLLWAIRDHVGLTGTKYGCGASLCGACTEACPVKIDLHHHLLHNRRNSATEKPNRLEKWSWAVRPTNGMIVL